MLYKYRGLNSFEFALDIFVNQRLYAANYQELNDPMEGQFIYSRELLTQKEVSHIRGQKARYRIVSLSETPHNMLMWSYYSDAHFGFVVGVEIPDNQAIKRKVEYVDSLKASSFDLSKPSDVLALDILSRKLTLWEHERETRVFVDVNQESSDKFVSVEIKELLFGIKACGPKRDLLKTIAEKFCPGLSIRTIDRNDLDTGQAWAYEV